MLIWSLCSFCNRAMSLLTYWMWTRILLWSVIVPVTLRLVLINNNNIIIIAYSTQISIQIWSNARINIHLSSLTHLSVITRTPYTMYITVDTKAQQWKQFCPYLETSCMPVYNFGVHTLLSPVPISHPTLRNSFFFVLIMPVLLEELNNVVYMCVTQVDKRMHLLFALHISNVHQSCMQISFLKTETNSPSTALHALIVVILLCDL